jgi:hypothetical protein
MRIGVGCDEYRIGVECSRILATRCLPRCQGRVFSRPPKPSTRTRAVI